MDTHRSFRPQRSLRTFVVVIAALVALLAASCLPGADIAPKSGTGTATVPTVFHDIRAATHTEEEGFDRVVFEFVDQLPDWDVTYAAKPVLLQPSGQATDLAGALAIVVTMHHAAGQWSLSPQAYAGPTRFTPATPEIAEVVQLQDFEGVLTWAIGVNRLRAFRVSTLAAPPRLVIDVAHT